ncbi:tRNA isopentenyltransferase [Epithele typhae]|uniref:tRNA isopentenyltransferase n=1 Tax=Epithele typhae TaxID=378194 RepID=UPI002008CEAA|nr:tRNA isopentenyltransferase [Epithele typhae]KAH9946381.1 tRNA isopentenyltransferase [Epithele typhae]
MPSKPLIVICGTTGVGKSKLGIELALSLAAGHHNHPYRGAKIINADSMQVYTGMDVITNKVPVEERCGVEHLLMDYKEPGEQLTGPEWIADAITEIDKIHEQGEVPIVVGGTSYWIQHLIFPERMASIEKPSESLGIVPTSSQAFSDALAALPEELRALFDKLPEQAPLPEFEDAPLALHRLLAGLDPSVAQRWHWRDTRRVLTCLRVMRDNRRLASEVYEQQSRVVSRPRYRTLCFWLYAEPDALKPRLDERVDQMIAQGLLNEIQTLRSIVSASTSAQTPSEASPQAQMDYTLGIYQAIGYKEFHNYLNSPGRQDSAFSEAVDQMKLGTRRYAKRQISWIRNKLLPTVFAANSASREEGTEPEVPTYILDATELGDAWTANVHDRGIQITKAFLEGTELPDPAALSQAASTLLEIREKPTDPLAVLSAHQRRQCDVCTTNAEQPVMVDGQKWEEHQRSKAHKTMTRKLNGRSASMGRGDSDKV